MLRMILDHYRDDLPDDCRVCFCNTGKEYPETLDFVDEVSHTWGIPIIWLEYFYDGRRSGYRNDPRHLHRIVDYVTASRDGKPFSEMNKARKWLPNPSTRTCTEQLKVKTISRFVRRELGWKNHRDVIGIRVDEPKRLNGAIFDHCRIDFPLALNGITKAMVMDFWERECFDLQLEPDQSNCNLCFLKGKAKLIKLIQSDQAMADWWIEEERKASARFKKEYRYEDLLDIALCPDLDAVLDTGDDEAEGISCFCGD